MRKPNPFKKLLNGCKVNGRRRLLYNGEQPKVLISEEDLKQIWIEQSGNCFWFGVPLDLGLLFNTHPEWFPIHPMAPSIDRKDDKGEYIKENIVICCRFANLGRCLYPFDKTKRMIQTLKGEYVQPTQPTLEDFLS